MRPRLPHRPLTGLLLMRVTVLIQAEGGGGVAHHVVPHQHHGAPMIGLDIDYSDFEAFAKRMNVAEDQIPFAVALAMNRSADVTRNFLIRATWPQHVEQRNNSFIAASLTTKDARANKRSLSVEIYDKLDRGNLLLQAEGGTRTPHGGSSIAVPASDVPRTSRGVPQRLRPRNITNTFKKNGVLYQRRGKRLKLIYTLKAATKLPKRVPFKEDYAASMSRELNRTLPMAFERAMATRR